MEPKEYLVIKIDGDYAQLVPVDHPEEEPNPVARALLPMETDEGTQLLWENFTYTVIGENAEER